MTRRPRVIVDEDEAPQLPATAPRHPWDRLPGESAQSYSRFLIYRNMTMLRSVRRVAESLGMKERVVAALSQTYKWINRTEAYVDYMAKQQELARIDAIRQLEKDELSFGGALMATGQKALAMKNKRPKAAGLVNMSGSEIAKMGMDGSVLRRRSMGLPIADKGTAVNVNVQTNVLAGWLAKVDEAGSPPEEQ